MQDTTAWLNRHFLKPAYKHAKSKKGLKSFKRKVDDEENARTHLGVIDCSKVFAHVSDLHSSPKGSCLKDPLNNQWVDLQVSEDWNVRHRALLVDVQARLGIPASKAPSRGNLKGLDIALCNILFKTEIFGSYQLPYLSFEFNGASLACRCLDLSRVKPNQTQQALLDAIPGWVEQPKQRGQHLRRAFLALADGSPAFDESKCRNVKTGSHFVNGDQVPFTPFYRRATATETGFDWILQAQEAFVRSGREFIVGPFPSLKTRRGLPITLTQLNENNVQEVKAKLLQLQKTHLDANLQELDLERLHVFGNDPGHTFTQAISGFVKRNLNGSSKRVRRSILVSPNGLQEPLKQHSRRIQECRSAFPVDPKSTSLSEILSHGLEAVYQTSADVLQQKHLLRERLTAQMNGLVDQVIEAMGHRPDHDHPTDVCSKCDSPLQEDVQSQQSCHCRQPVCASCSLPVLVSRDQMVPERSFCKCHRKSRHTASNFVDRMKPTLFLIGDAGGPAKGFKIHHADTRNAFLRLLIRRCNNLQLPVLFYTVDESWTSQCCTDHRCLRPSVKDGSDWRDSMADASVEERASWIRSGCVEALYRGRSDDLSRQSNPRVLQSLGI
jgi:hypothetical protein